MTSFLKVRFPIEKGISLTLLKNGGGNDPLDFGPVVLSFWVGLWQLYDKPTINQAILCKGASTNAQAHPLNRSTQAVNH